MGFFKIPTAIQAMAAKPKITGCLACKLDQSGKDSTFAGDGKDRVLILCDHPRGTEGNTHDTVFMHKMYDYLWDLQGKRGLPNDFLESAWIGYVLPCPCKKDQEPAPDCCKERLDRLIAKHLFGIGCRGVLRTPSRPTCMASVFPTATIIVGFARLTAPNF